MKTIIRLVIIGATLALLALPAVAKSLSTDAVAQDQCTDENKAAWYATFRENFKTEQQKAYDAAKKYLTACSSEDTPQTQYLKKFVDIYEKAQRTTILQTKLNEKNYPEAFKLGADILKDEPENMTVLINLGYAGYVTSLAKNNSFNTDAINYARKAIQLIESGKTVEAWTPFPNKDEALAFLTYYVATNTLNSGDHAGALPLLIKAAKFESSLKKSPYTYANIASAYENGSYAKLSEDYKAKFGGKDESPEQKLALENVNQVVDRIIDAYARAVASAGADPKFATDKKVWSDALSGYYKYRHKDETGLNELVAGVLSKPLPPEPTPLTSLPVSAPAATPNSGNGASGATTGTPTPGTNTASNTGATTTTQKSTAPAATTTVPVKPAAKRPQH